MCDPKEIETMPGINGDGPVAKKSSGIHRFGLVMATVHDHVAGVVGTVAVEQAVHIHIYLYILRLGFSGTKKAKERVC
jgi:hypothetical protein